MATSLLAPFGVLTCGLRPPRSPHRVETLRYQKLRHSLWRMAAAPAALALLMGGAILSQNAHPPQMVAAANQATTTSAALVRPPLTLSAREAAPTPVFYDYDGDPDQAAITWARRLPVQEAEPGGSVLALPPNAASAIMQFGPMKI